MNNLINKLKESNEDYEFYPATSKMIKVIYDNYIKDKTRYDNVIDDFSMLDIGAGNGNVFDLFDSYLPKAKDEYSRKAIITKFAIEKSEILIINLPPDIIVVGTDFDRQLLLDKQVNLIYCNQKLIKNNIQYLLTN
jgi:hypothetical protein